MTEITITGLKEIQERLERLSPDLAKKAMGKALAAGGRVLATEIQLKAPKRTGELALSVLAKGKTSEHGGYIRVGIRYRKKRAATSRRPGKVPSTEDPGIYSRFLEYGTRNMAARPFVRPSYDAKKDEATQAFVDTLKEWIEKADHK